MTRYRVDLYGLAQVRQSQDIEADTPEEAAELAADNDSNHVWKYQQIQSISQAHVMDYYNHELVLVKEVSRG